MTNDFAGIVRPQDGDGVGGAQYDIGAYERMGASAGPFEVDFYGEPVVEGLGSIEVVFHSVTAGSNSVATYYGWDFDNDGTKELEGANYSIVTNRFGPGFYSIMLVVSNSSMETATRTRINYVHVSPAILYVAPDGGNEIPYTNWAMAANNLSDAVNFSLDGAKLKLSNGVYNLSSTLVINKNITLEGVYGASNTVIRRVGSSNMRVIYLDGAGAVLDGLRITNGYDNSSSFNGVGIYMTKGTVRNCIIEKNTIAGNAHGAGIYMLNGLVENSIIRDNVANLHGAGIYIAGGIVRNCYVMKNWAGRWNAGYTGGGFYINGGIVRNCLIIGNKGGTSVQGGGVYVNSGILESSTISGNKGGTDAGGVYRNGGSITNCIIWDNQIESLAIDNIGGAIASFWYSCSPELSNPANHNITNDPKFVATGSGYGPTMTPGNYRLQPDSPCVNAGILKNWMLEAKDLDNNPRYAGAAPDMGAYEQRVGNGTIFMIK